MQENKKRRISVLFFSIILILIVAGVFFNKAIIIRLDAISSNPNSFIRHFSPTWRSIKRIVDTPFVLVYSLRETKLPIFEINLTKKDKANLLNNLPNYPLEAGLYEQYKKTVKGEFQTGSYSTSDAKIRYRGVSPNHWNAVKKSWQINLPDEYPLKERTTLRLFLPEDKGWVIGALNSYRAKKLGLISPEISYVRVKENKENLGVYLLIEGWEESMLEKNGRFFGPIFSNQNLDIKNTDLLRPESIDIWENRFEKEIPDASDEILPYFLKLIANSTDDVFENELPNIIDMEQLYNWMVVSILSGSMHQGNLANQNLYFNHSTGKLEPILFDVAFQSIENAIDIQGNRLINRVMKSDKFKKEFYKVMQAYMNNPNNIVDDLNFYDKTRKFIRPEILSDTKKIQTSLEVLNLIKKQREDVKHNYETLANMLSKNGEIAFLYSDEVYPLKETKFDTTRFEKTMLRINAKANEFVRNNPQFKLKGNSKIILKKQTHFFTKTVIIPKGLHVTIEPGARLLFGPDVSFLSYSSIKSNGAVNNPVILKALYPNRPWGVFAVLNTPEKNILTHTYIYDGKDATINGIYFSGSLSAHNSDLKFSNGIIKNSHADDGIHILSSAATISKSKFLETNSDGIDIDFAEGVSSLFENNVFENIGGDAMDLSFSEITIKNNTVVNCTDKGISVGEASNPVVEQNYILNCSYGIAIKDASYALINSTVLLKNNTGLGLYRKKPHFISGGTAKVTNSVIWDNNNNTISDIFSSALINDSTVEGGYSGINISTKEPDLALLLPKNIIDKIKNDPVF